ncbi:CPXCG motif-containing cysteine-rich protein [Microcoleus sp. herbarium12]|uniref:CPXCG motif-containing cysteine-rich protein n=1 Tax=Microcoleus sp. herbarium12 TaxID=3055437 RepID=UPI002FD33551
MQTTAEYYCAFCGEPSTTFVDISGGMEQSYIEDCQVCCRPNVLYVRIVDIHPDLKVRGFPIITNWVSAS